MFKILKNHYIISFVIIAALLVTAFSNVVFGGKTLTTTAYTVGTTPTGPYLYQSKNLLPPVVDKGSSAWHWEPAMQLNSRAYRDGQLPVWNPYNGAGQPLAADMQSSSFYPLALPVLLNPSPAVWDFFLLLRLLVAGFLTYLFLRLINIKTAGAIAGAITFMLSGYLIFFVNMAFLNVEILIPLALLTTELLVQRRKIYTALSLAISVAFIITGGMPESAVLNLGFATLYFVYRLGQGYKNDRDLGPALRTGLLFGSAIVVGIIISAIAWLPFLEYYRLFWSRHGSQSLGAVFVSRRYLVQYLAPLFAGVRLAHLGVLPLFLSIVTKKENRVKWFFIIAAIVIGLKTFGVLNSLGFLPLLNKIWLYKYGQGLLAMSVAVLTAISIDSGLKANPKWVAAVSIAWVGSLYFAYTNIGKFFNPTEIKNAQFSHIPHTRWALLFLGLGAALVVAPRVIKKLRPGHLAVAATVLIFLDLWFHIPSGRAERQEPYLKPPFVKFLQSQKGFFRTYAVGNVFWPNINAVYRIQDIRSLNAMQPESYTDYLSFFSDLRELPHIEGVEDVNLGSSFLDALNVRYVLALQPLEKSISIGQKSIKKVKLDDNIFYRAPFSKVLKIPRDTKFLNFQARAEQKEKLVIKAVDGTKRFSTFDKPIEPGTSNHRLAIKRLAGKLIKFEFEGNVLLTNFHYSNSKPLSAKFKKVFVDKTINPPVTIYENRRFLPRVAAYNEVVYAKNSLSALAKLDIRKKALVEERLAIAKSSEKLNYRAEIIEYEPQEVKIKVKTNKQALLVLADTYYPGWKAYVNGKERPVVKANHTFRGVVISPSAKYVTFRYEPDSYKTSFGLMGIAFLAILGLAIGGRLTHFDIP